MKFPCVRSFGKNKVMFDFERRTFRIIFSMPAISRENDMICFHMNT